MDKVEEAVISSLSSNRLKTIRRARGMPPIAVIDGSLPSHKQLSWVARRNLGLVVENLPAEVTDLSFLEQLRPCLTELQINAAQCRDASAIASLDALRNLTLWIKSERPVALSHLKIQSFEGYWDETVDSIFECSSLKYLHLEGPPANALKRTPRHVEYLQFAAIKGKKYDLMGMPPRESLQEINLALAREVDLTGVESLRGLRRISLIGIKQVSNAHFLSRCNLLEKIWIEECAVIEGLTDGLDGPLLKKVHVIGKPSSLAPIWRLIEERGLKWEQEPEAQINPLRYKPFED